ncbi:MAG TPA: dihydrofolate reductase family protein [Baekduia sp.]|uniref:dihydrofolate reductase family protein n=1 Tax=Baekduia sp. TaxID=2600305 RepID=UPI002D78C0A7|nr:dihydrofolate reductase family protein [Baekduia sp.]HET6507617.1 dihydrofolate reductase family protein [Baekduia sp.]
MAALIYSAIASLDGYVADAEGKFDWSAPDEEVHAYVNDQERPIGTYIYGRKMYDVMKVWQDDGWMGAEPDPVMHDYATIWRAAEKVVVSSTLAEPATPSTRIMSSFDADALRTLVRDAPTDVSIGGPTIAAEALRAGLVDEIGLFLSPVTVGGGLRALPDDLRANLSLLAQRRFANGVVHVRYAVDR